VVWCHGPGYCYHRRFQAEQGNAVQLCIKPVRQIPSLIGNERGSDTMSLQDDNCNVPVLTRSSVGTIGVGWDRAGSSIEEENRSCDSIPSASYDEFDGIDFSLWE